MIRNVIRSLFRSVIGSCGLLSCAASLIAQDPGSKPVNFVRDVRPILARNCYECHGPDEGHRKAELRLDTATGAFSKTKDSAAFVPKNLADSEAFQRIISTDDSQRMPPPKSGKTITPEQIEILKRWIEQGAPWSAHWAFEKPVRPALPEVSDAKWGRNDIDRFVLARLDKEGLKPSSEADRQSLARRVALDLTGLPPAPELVAEFVRDQSPDAYEKLVDRLLQSSAYGERWTRLWLDLARYADTRGYEKDRSRTIWRYRDWLIDAFNADMPFDQFTREQLAGDLLPNPTSDQLLATAMHRNTMVNEEGGTDDEEFRIAAVKDRVDTTLQVWMGLTMGCAKCHSHKYDPLPQREYYQFYAFFNQTADSDKGDESPTAPTPTKEQTDKSQKVNAEIAALQQRIETPTPEIQAELAAWEAMAPTTQGWSRLKPEKMAAASGSAMKPQEDGSILVEGAGPAKEQYVLNFPYAEKQLTGLRLEVIPDKSLPKGGVGRSLNDGNFVLSAIRVAWKSKSGEVKDIPLAKAEADFAQTNYPVEHALKNDDVKKHGWAVSPQLTQPHTAVFTVGEARELAEATELIVTLDHQFEFNYPGFSIGRFRVSTTTDAQPTLKEEIPAAILAIVQVPADKRTADQQQQLYRHVAQRSKLTQPLRDEIAKKQGELAANKPTDTPIFRELPADKQRVTNIHVRGNFLTKGDEVTAAVPTAFHAFPADAPRNRLGVALWLTDPNNPLTARVAVNRFWAQLFGIGLVESQEDFGIQGLPPSHPELLDWLATEFVRDGWSMKRLCKLIVMSATYRQSSRVTPQLMERDRFNRLLARGPRYRLEAEMLRDQALAVSGLLSRKMYGPSVMPPQPDGIWRSTYNLDKWKTSPGEDKYRRGLYTFIKRTSPYPSMMTFDGPSREICTIRRINTNTPLQALVLLNDPVYVETAQALARRMVQVEGSIDAQLAAGFQAALIRAPHPRELAALRQLYDQRLKFYQHDAIAAEQMAVNPLGAAPKGVDHSVLAALTAVCNVILNLDEFVTRG
ncbi:MAG: hypothetical protein JWN70_902 [Planctomycetaceae bacterium]|nr:hypothetical protein [Planctomycetaceae bacterium]